MPNRGVVAGGGYVRIHAELPLHLPKHVGQEGVLDRQNYYLEYIYLAFLYLVSGRISKPVIGQTSIQYVSYRIKLNS